MFRSSEKPSKYMRKITCAKRKGIVDMIHCLVGRSCFKLSLTSSWKECHDFPVNTLDTSTTCAGTQLKMALSTSQNSEEPVNTQLSLTKNFFNN
mmetsp:Transcript_56544/g.92010  ORF Transcript_56544/g.92010 Transcript_56544/m.92010 type:complete len:94 (-) Transcript_56544:317-598(-)